MRQWTVDAFASQPFKGNPACVVEPASAWPDAVWMQALAQENNQAETAFTLKTADPSRFGLRWFTTVTEMPLCGHATLACAHVLFTELGNGSGSLTFETLSGELIVRRAGAVYEMDFPADDPAPIPTPEGLAEALGATPVEVLAGNYLVAVLDSEAAVRGLKPSQDALRRSIEAVLPGRGAVSVVALADAGGPFDVVSRFFAPGVGIAEDPVTGAAHCMLSPLFSRWLEKPVVRFHQAFPGRGGDLECEIRGNRVLLRGQAVTVVESMLRV